MKRSLLLGLIILGFILPYNPPSYSAGYANCVSVSSAEINKEFGNLVYSLKIRDLCDSGIRSYKLTLKSNKFSVPDVTNSYVILFGYSKSITFSLKNYSPGDYNPSLEISSSEDFERSTISLPGFRIDSPINCLQIMRSGLDPSSLSYTYSLTVKNVCSSLDSYSFGNVYFELQGAGLNSGSQKLFSVSDYGTSLTFRLSGITSGTYFPSLYVRDFTNSGSKSFQVSGFTIGKGSPKSSESVSSKQVCVSGKNYSEECFDYPDWTYEICSSNQSGKVQIKSGSTWLFGWNFKGTKDLDRCQADNPFLITISGYSKASANLRLYFAMYQSKPTFYSNFKVTVR